MKHRNVERLALKLLFVQHWVLYAGYIGWISQTVLTFGGYGGGQFLGAGVPEPDGLVAARRGQLVGVTGVPRQLVHAVTVAAERVVLDLRHTTHSLI